MEQGEKKGWVTDPWGTVPVICSSYCTAPSLPSGPYTLHSHVPVSFCDTWGISKVGPIWDLWPSRLREMAAASLLLVGAESRCFHWKCSCPRGCVRPQMSSKRDPSETGPWMLGVTVAKEKTILRKDCRQVHVSSLSLLLLMHPSFITSSNLFSLSSSILGRIIKLPKKHLVFSRVLCSAMP